MNRFGKTIFERNKLNGVQASYSGYKYEKKKQHRSRGVVNQNKKEANTVINERKKV